MEKSIKAGLRRIRSNSFCLFFVVFFLFSTHSQAYTDQVVIELPHSVKTVYDIRVFSYIRQLVENQSPPDTLSDQWMISSFEEERSNFIKQYLVLNYVVENELPLTPSFEVVEKSVKKVENYFPNRAELEKSFQKMNIKSEDVRAWIFARMIFDSFLSGPIQDRVIISEEKLKNHYETFKDSRFSGKPYVGIEQEVKNDLTKLLLKEEFEKWIDQEKIRRKMILKMVSSK